MSSTQQYPTTLASQMSTATTTVTRKQHQVPNGYIDVDNVSIEAGNDYSDWIDLTKKKLMERERVLMAVRIDAIHDVINKQCKSFETEHECKVNVYNADKIKLKEIVDGCLNKLDLSLKLWNGVNLNKTKKALTTFRKYFVIGKCWFDQRKKHILAPYFWIKLFLILQQFTMHSASIFFNDNFKNLQKLYSKHLLLTIIYGIFSNQLHFASTKSQPLIPCGILKDNDAMKQYLVQNIHCSLNIHSLIQQPQSNKSIKTMNAKEMLKSINKQLLYLINEARDEFKEEFQAINNINNHALSWNNNAFDTTDCSVSNHTDTTYQESIYNQQQQQQQQQVTEMYNYGGTHCCSQSVIFNRYNPIQSVYSTQQQHRNHINNFNAFSDIQPIYSLSQQNNMNYKYNEKNNNAFSDNNNNNNECRECRECTNCICNICGYTNYE